MEMPLSLSVSTDVDSIVAASSIKRSADEMESDCCDSSVDLPTSTKRFHRANEPPSQADNLLTHVENNQPGSILTVNNTDVAHVEHQTNTNEQATADKNMSDVASSLSTNDDNATEKIFSEAEANLFSSVKCQQKLIEEIVELKCVITDEITVCQVGTPKKVKDVVDCISSFSNVDGYQINEVPITESPKCEGPKDERDQESEFVKNINIENTSTDDRVDDEVLNLSTKSLISSDCIKPAEISCAIEAFGVDMEVVSDALDLPIDLSVGHKSSPSPLSLQSNAKTHEQACIQIECDTYRIDSFISSNGHSDENIARKVLAKKRVPTIKRLQDELRNEESKLVLLRKLRQNQVFYQYLADSAHSRGIGERQISQHPPRLLNNLPPPAQSVRGMPQSLMGNNRLSGSPHRVNNSGVGMNDPSSRLLPAKSQHGQPPPLVLAPQASPTVSQMSLLGSLRTLSSSITTQCDSHGSPIPLLNIRVPPPQPPTQQPPTAVVSMQPPANEQSPAQRQAAAKLALRKQLEKTLLQIPPPKPPPPEMNFVPNSLNGEFVILLGLEEAVKCIVDNDARAKGHAVSEVKYVFNPFQCVQCNTDFTPVWKRDRPGSRNVICERCVTTNQKKALKQEHTNRLKSAFVKALQQEQEIEQSIHGNGGGNFGTGLSNSSQFVMPNSSMISTHATMLSSVSASSKNHPLSSGYPHRPGGDIVHSQSNTPQHLLPIIPPFAGIRPSATTPTSAGSLTFNPNLFFPFPPKSIASNSNSNAEMQRQYLLDMIPHRPPLDLPILWRT